MLRLAPAAMPAASPHGRAGHPCRAAAEKRGRVAILTGCAQPVLDPGINEATISLLTRLGVEVVVPAGEGCCGALVHHMGREEAGARLRPRAMSTPGRARSTTAGSTPSSSPRRAAAPRSRTTASCCGSIRPMPKRRHGSRRWPRTSPNILATPRPAGAGAQARPRRRLSFGLLDAARPEDHARSRRSCWPGAGFTVQEPREGHLCCGSAGTYNILQPEISGAAARPQGEEHRGDGRRRSSPPATSAASPRSPSAAGMPVVHTVELLDWAYGGPKPEGAGGLSLLRRQPFRGVAFLVLRALAAERHHRVAQQDRHRDRADAARHRRDPGRDVPHAFGVDIADDAAVAVGPISELMPMSMTAAPGLTMSALISRGLPTATNSASARRAWAATERVMWWQTVTVAPSPSAGRRSACRRFRNGRRPPLRAP